MSWTEHVFVGTDEPVNAVIEAIEEAFAGTFIYPEGDSPYLTHGQTDIYVGPHDFDDDVIQWPDGSWVHLATRYPYWVEIRDIDRNIERQHQVARHVFDALKARGKWSLVYIDDMQEIFDSYDPNQEAS